jgi:UDP-MurNAc hydroxylase
MEKQGGNMQITAIGHAGFWVDCGTDKILCDPWVSLAGAYAAAWFPFPSNEYLDLGQLETATHLYISHWHRDHLDQEFLTSRSPEFKQQVQVITGQFYAPKLRDWLSDWGYSNLIELANNTEITTPSGTRLHLQTDENPSFADSALTIASQEQVFLNTNDCKLSIQQELDLVARFGPIQVMAAQFSGATFHPTCFDYPSDKQRAISSQRRAHKYRRILESLERLQVQVYLPSAGPACFLSADLAHLNLNPDTIFAVPNDFDAWLREQPSQPAAKFVLLCPGDSWQTETDTLQRGSDLIDHYQTPAYLSQLAAQRQPAIAAELAKYQRPIGNILSDAQAHFRELLANVPTLAKLANAALVIELTGESGGQFVVYLPTGEILAELPNLPPEQLPQRYTITLSTFWMRALVDRLISWEDFVLSFRLLIHAEPDVFNEPVAAFLQLESQAEREAFVHLLLQNSKQAPVRIQRQHNGQLLEYDRFCPHNGEDLANAPIENGEIICLRHFWRFGITDGQGTNNKCSLHVKVL